MKQLWPLLAAAVLVAPGAASASSKPVVLTRGAIIKTNLDERFQFRSGTKDGELKLHVTKFEVSGQTWKASVGVTNLSETSVSLQAKLEKSYWSKPFVY